MTKDIETLLSRSRQSGGDSAPSHRPRKPFLLILILCACSILWSLVVSILWSPEGAVILRPKDADNIISRCKSLKVPAGPPKNFALRSKSDRYEEQTSPTLIRNGTIWTGNHNGTEIIRGDILLHHGIIKQVGQIHLSALPSDTEVLDVKGSWVTPGIIDIHSHLGDYPAPDLAGTQDGNSLQGTAQPWLRSLDGLNTHDDAYPLSVSGGVTTALILPGSANAIGGQAFVIKLRPTKEKSTISMVVEPPLQVNGTDIGTADYIPWRHMKHACGENPSRVYSHTRMDSIWHFRESYNAAKNVLRQQDEFCDKALNDEWDGLGHFPEDLKWEALVDVLRGRVKINIHCYEAVDLDALVRLSNEFKFPIAAFHHAHETYLVPDLLKKAFGKPPGVAMFATNARYKREAYRGSEFAPKIIAEHGLDVTMKSDHPVLDSRHLIYEAQQAHFYGLSPELSLAAVTSTSARLMGLDHRMGYVREGYDADIVVWDSHPLVLAATPQQVFIDGQAQLTSPAVIQKGRVFQKVPKVPDFGDAAERAVEYDGLPPLSPRHVQGPVLFTNVKSVYLRGDQGIEEQALAQDAVVLAQAGKIICIGAASCSQQVHGDPLVIDLKCGEIVPGLTAYGSPMGLEEIQLESSTNDGTVYDPLANGVFGGDGTLIRAVDGLLYETRDAQLAYVYGGVTAGISAPVHGGFYGGLGVAFSMGAAHKLERGAVVQGVTALHVSVLHGGDVPSISTKIGTLRRLLLGSQVPEFVQVAEGNLTLVVDAHGRDTIASLIALKAEVEAIKGSMMKMTITGATEAHHLAAELGQARIGIVVNPSKPFPANWENRRLLPGPPLTDLSLISQLVLNNVTVGLGIYENWATRNLRFDIGYAAIQSNGVLSKRDALALASTNIERLVGVTDSASSQGDLVATQGGELTGFSSKTVAVISSRRGFVDVV